MPNEPKEFPELDRIVHEPARLAILTVLASCEAADFNFLLNATCLTKGNLSVQLTRLEDAGIVSIDKAIERKKTLTTVTLTRKGKKDLAKYWQIMETLRRRALL